MRVLVVDDDPVARRVVDAIVCSLGHDCLTAEDGRRAWELLEADSGIDVVITDRVMPDMDGLELCQRIRRGTASGAYTYVVVASGSGDDDDARNGMLAGADDYLAKPLRRTQLELKLIAAERVRDLHQRLGSLNAELRTAARRDPLTGLGNRLQLTEDLESLADRARRYGHHYSLALLDVDHFKPYNDQYGHQAGDVALQAVAKVLTTHTRTGDAAYRYGGEEFLCVFPEQSSDTALIATQRMLAAVRRRAIVHVGTSHGVVTLSAGIADLGGEDTDVDRVLRRADEALYEAKGAGRDCVVQSARPLPA